MALDVVQPTSVQERPHSKGRRQCSCCPYGYHIDLDFVRYCESITTAQLMPSPSVRKNRWHNVRRKRASREALLGLVEQQPKTVYAEQPSVDSNDMGDGWHKAVMDFEKTLKHASLPRMCSKKNWNGLELHERINYSQPEKNVSPGNVNSSHTLPRNKCKTEKDGVNFVLPIEEMLFAHANSNNASAETLQNIREQMAASLRRMRELEEQIKVIPRLNDHIGHLRIENEKLKEELKHKEAHQTPVAPVTSSDRTTSTHDLVHCRAAAVGCVVLTREVGVSSSATLSRTIGVGPDHKPESSVQQGEPVSLHKIIGIPLSFRHKNASVMTDSFLLESEKTPVIELVSHDMATSTDLKMSDLLTEKEMDNRIYEMRKKTAPPPKVSIRVNTHLQHDQIFTQNELDERVARFAKTYESNFLSTNLARKAKMIHSSVQTVDKRDKKQSKDIGLQVVANIVHVGVLVKPKTATSAHQTFKSTRDVGVSEDTTSSNICEKCTVKKSNFGTVFPERSEHLFQRINSKDEMTVVKRKSVSRSTDTQELLSTRDVSMNTSKKKLVSTAVETGDYSCKTCDQQMPPRPSVVPVPAKRPSYLPISVSRVKTPTTPSPLPQLQHEGSNSDSGSDDGTYTIHQDVGACIKGDDRSPMSRSYTRREPSKEMRGAMKVLNDALLKSPGGDIPKHVETAVNIVQQEWFKVSSVASANPLDVEYYLDCFEEISSTLLEYVVNMSDVSGNTAMHYAVSNGNFDVVSILLDSKVCNINKLNTAGYTCIMLVALTKVKSETDREVVRRLFHMADVNIRAKQHGQTALMLAVSHGRIDTVELLLEAGADINIQDDDGSTALMCAAEHGYIEIVKLLLAQPDCDLSITDYDGTTALAIAMEAGNRDVGVLLYAQEHFSRGSSPYTSLKHKRSKSTTPTLKSSRPTTPSHSSARKDPELES